MAKTMAARVRNLFRKMNLTEDENNPEKEEFKSNPEIARMLGIKNNATIWDTRRNLIFARKHNVDTDDYLVYAWRWSGDDRFAKIGVSMGSTLRERLVFTYHPIDEIKLIGVSIAKYSRRSDAHSKESSILKRLRKSHCKREWVYTNGNFSKLINEEFRKIDVIVKS